VPLNADEFDTNKRFEEGWQAAKNASHGGEVAIDKKPFGQTSETVYPYTYWWVKGWNAAVEDLGM
jgi:hypothetical protein